MRLETTERRRYRECGKLSHPGKSVDGLIVAGLDPLH